MSIEARAAFLSLLATALGCGGTVWPGAPEGPSPPRATSPASRPPFDVQSAARALARMRGLELREPVQVEELEADAFRDRRANDATSNESETRGIARRVSWSAFGFAQPGTNLADVARRVHDEQVAGFYDRRSKKLVVRKSVFALEASRSALMHEIEHALQDQNFGLVDRTSSRDDDANLALSSLYEGDATLASLAFHHDAANPPSREWLVRIARHVRSMPIDTFADQGGGPSKELVAAPALMRARFMSPYLDGTAFVADVYRAGGFALVNEVFRHLPVSTEQVLHAEKYVAGELPVPVDAPTAPSGHRVATSGRMGELQLAVFLAQCMPMADARRTAAGWGGDAYTVVLDASDEVGILFATAWDDEESASRFATALEARRACVAARGADGAALASTIGVRRDKTRVAYVHGLDASMRDPSLAQLVSLPRSTPAAAPPVGPVTIPLGALPEDFLSKGATNDEGRFESLALGVSFAVPRGSLIVEWRGEELRFRVGTSPPSLEASARFVLDPPSPAREAEFERGLSAAVRRNDARRVIKDDGVREVTYPFGRARVHRWSLANGALAMTVLAPACGGTGTLMFTAVWREPAALATIEEWLRSVELKSKDVPVCAYLAEPRRK